MVNENQKDVDSSNDVSTTQATALQGQLDNMLSGVERSLAVTCESIMDRMRQLEDKIQTMEKKYHEIAKEAESAIKEANNDTSKGGKTADS